MASTNRLTIIAELKDYLTGPLQRGTKAFQEFEAAAAKADKAAEGTSKSFEHVRNSAGKIVTGMSEADRALGRHYDNLGRVQEANGRWVKGAQKAAWANDELALAAAKAGKGADKQRASIGRLEAAVRRVDSALAAASGNGTTRLERALGRVQGGTSRLSKALGDVDPSSAVNRFARGMDKMGDYANKAAEKVTKAMGRVGRAVGLAAGALAGASLVGGGNRLMDLESADVKLDVMGYDEAARQSIMGTVDESVTGTPFALNEAATAATQYLAAGVAPGEDLAARLGTTVDMAAIYDMDLGEASTIMSKILATQTLQGDEANQLLERGMPVYAALAESMGVEQSEVKGLISEGKVSADDFFAAIAPQVEGGAGRLGDTFKGTFANLRTAFSRSGAAFLEPLMEPLKTLMGGMTQILKDGAPFFTALGNALGPGIERAAEWMPAIVDALAPLGGPLTRLFESLGDALPGIVQGIAVWAKMLSFVLIPLTEIAAILLDDLGPFLPVLVPLIFGVGAGFTAWRVLSFVGPLLGGVTKGLGALSRVIIAHPLLWIPLAIYTVLRVFGSLYDRIDWVREGFDWFSDTLSGVVGWFNGIGDAIDRLINEKLPALGNALQLDLGPLGKAAEFLQTGGADIGEKTGLHSWLGTGDSWGSGRGLLRMFHGSGAGDVPAHAEGGYTASGAHLAVVGEEGQEFVTNAWATSKIRSTHPGALEHMNRTGTPPVVQVPGASPIPSIAELHVHTNATDGATFAQQFAAEWNRRAREQSLTYATPTARGAY